MDLNKIQSVLESLPDQDIAKYAQQPSPQVPQVLAQMELQRRATLRQAAQMQSKGGIGMAAGGAVERYSKGGPLQFGAMSEEYLAEQEKILEEAKRKRGEQMKGGFFGGLGGLIGDGVTAVKDAAQRAIDKDRGAFATDRAMAVLAEGPTAFQKGKVPPVAAPMPEQEAPPVQTPPAAMPEQVSPTPQSRMPEVEAPAPVAPMPKPLDPNADPRMAQLESALKQKGDVIAKAVEEEMSLRKNAMVPVNEEKERNRQLYTALGQWGSALLLSRSYGVANATAINTLQNELAKSEEKREAFKKASLDTALTEIKYRLEQAGAPVDNIKALEALRANIMKEAIDQREQTRKERDTESDVTYKDRAGRAALKNAESSRISVERPRSGANQELTFEDALKLAEDQIKNDKINALKYKTPEARQQAVQTLAKELYDKNLAVLRAVRTGGVPVYPGASTPAAATSGMIDFSKLPK